MRKWILAGTIISLLMGSSAYAHVAGVFGAFLTGLTSESTTEKLRKEIKETKREIEDLAPKVAQYEKEYQQQESTAITKLQFYNSNGVDTMMNFVLQSDDIVDVLSNQKMVEKNLEEYLQELNGLYLQYMQLKVTKETLEGQEKLLQIIRDNLQARQKLFNKYANAGLTIDEVQNAISTIWGRDTATIDEMSVRDSIKLEENINQLFVRKTSESPYRMDEKSLNEIAELDYYFRSDHIYAHFQNGEADVILIGTMEKDNDQSFSLVFEDGFMNGLQIPEQMIVQIPGFSINLAGLDRKSKGFYVEQTNGSIVIQAKHKAVE